MAHDAGGGFAVPATVFTEKEPLFIGVLEANTAIGAHPSAVNVATAPADSEPYAGWE